MPGAAGTAQTLLLTWWGYTEPRQDQGPRQCLISLPQPECPQVYGMAVSPGRENSLFSLPFSS